MSFPGISFFGQDQKFVCYANCPFAKQFPINSYRKNSGVFYVIWALPKKYPKSGIGGGSVGVSPQTQSSVGSRLKHVGLWYGGDRYTNWPLQISRKISISHKNSLSLFHTNRKKTTFTGKSYPNVARAAPIRIAGTWLSCKPLTVPWRNLIEKTYFIVNWQLFESFNMVSGVPKLLWSFGSSPSFQETNMEVDY